MFSGAVVVGQPRLSRDDTAGDEGLKIMRVPSRVGSLAALGASLTPRWL